MSTRVDAAERVRLARAHLESLGLRPYAAAPPAFRLLWRLGLHVPPPLFMGFVPLAVFGALFFAVLWGGLMGLMFWPQVQQVVSASIAVIVSALAGLLFGLGVATATRWKASRLRLPRWRDFPAGSPSKVGA